mgnify:CR=1 FL=1
MAVEEEAEAEAVVAVVAVEAVVEVAVVEAEVVVVVAVEAVVEVAVEAVEEAVVEVEEAEEELVEAPKLSLKDTDTKESFLLKVKKMHFLQKIWYQENLCTEKRELPLMFVYL